MLDSKIQGPFTDPTGETFLLRVAVQETITPDVLFGQRRPTRLARRARRSSR